MPEVSRFYGLVVRMYSRGEHPPPHFHVQYGEHRATISIDAVDIVEGWLPRRALRLVQEWARLHQHELRENWGRALMHKPLTRIDPLP